LGGGKGKAFTAAEVAAQRAKPQKSSTDVFAERQALQSAKIIE
jgi:hypothetical protein